MFIQDIYEDIKNALQLRREENKAKELSLKLIKEFQSLDQLKKWFDLKTYGVTPTGVFYETKIEKIFITIEPKKKSVVINGQMSDGSYLDQAYKVSEDEIRKIAEEIASNSLEKLKEEREYLEDQLSKVNSVISSTEERIEKNEFSSTVLTEEEKKSKKEAKAKIKKMLSKSKKK